MQSDEQQKKILLNTPKKTGIRSSRISPVSIKKSLEPTEMQIVKVILDYLALRKIYTWRNNSATMFYSSKGKDYAVRMGKKGSSDIIGLLPNGVFLGIEVKRPKGIVSPDQILFLDHIKQNKGVAFVAYSLDDVIRELKNVGF